MYDVGVRIHFQTRGTSELTRGGVADGEEQVYWWISLLLWNYDVRHNLDVGRLLFSQRVFTNLLDTLPFHTSE